MVLTTITHADGCSKDRNDPHSANTWKEGNDTRCNQENDTDGVQSIRRSLATQGISKRAPDIILQSCMETENTETICLVYQTVDQVLS